MFKPSSILVSMMMAASMFAALGHVFAGENTSLPFADDFESYDDQTPLIDGVKGWYGSSGSIMVQTNTICTGMKAAVIPAGGTLTNRFADIPRTNIWLQMDLRSSAQAWCLAMTTNGLVLSTNAGGTTNGINWVRFNIYENFEQTNASLYANGVFVTNNNCLFVPVLTNFAGFKVLNGTATNCFMDNVSVSASLTNTQPPLIVVPSALTPAVFVGKMPTVQTVKIYNVWSSSISFAVATTSDWLSASLTNGNLAAGKTQDVTLTYSGISAWPAGAVSNTLLTVVATNATDQWGTQRVALSMSVMDLRLTRTVLTNKVMLGRTPTNQSFMVTNGGAGTFSFMVTNHANAAWLSGSVTNASVGPYGTATIQVKYASTALWPLESSNGTIMVISTDGGGATQSLDVVLDIMHLTNNAAADGLTANIMQGESATNSFKVWNAGDGYFRYRVATNKSWLVVTPSSGTLTGHVDGATNTLLVTYTNTELLTVGVNTGKITISSSDGAGATNEVQAILTVRAAAMLHVSPMLLTNTVMEGQSPAAQALSVINGSTYDSIGYQVTTNQGGAGASWLFVQVTNSLLAPGAKDCLTITTSNLTSAGDAPSNYYGAIVVTATNASGVPVLGSPVTNPFVVNVNPKPSLCLSLTNLVQTVSQGRDALNQSFDVWNGNGFYTLRYTVSNNAAWLIPTALSGSSTGQQARIVLQYSTANLPVGTNSTLITVVGRAWDGVHEDCARYATQQIAVVLSVTPFASLTTDAHAAYSYIARRGAPDPSTSFNVWNGGYPAGAMSFTLSSSASWLEVTPRSGTSSGNKVAVQVQADISSMRPGVVYSATVTLNATDVAADKPAYETPQTFKFDVLLRNFNGLDFQGGFSGASDLVLYREANGEWQIRNLLSKYASTQFLGGASYQAVPGDYLGDGVTDLGIYRSASGGWYARQIGQASAEIIGGEITTWADTGYIGVPGDYDGDGITDLGVYLEQCGLWMVMMSGNNYKQESGILGGPGYMALPAGDYDGDCIVDPAVYHRTTGLWMARFSTSDTLISGTFGGEEFEPVPADYDADGLTDPAVYETNTGIWYILPSTTFTSQGYGRWTRQFGGVTYSTSLVPVPGNYDGVGGADLALYDTSTWRWYILTLEGVPLAWGYPMGYIGCVPVK